MIVILVFDISNGYGDNGDSKDNITPLQPTKKELQ